MDIKHPYLVIFWSDTREPLTFKEYRRLAQGAEVVHASPREILLQPIGSTRKVVVQGITDPAAPPVPKPRRPPR